MGPHPHADPRLGYQPLGARTGFTPHEESHCWSIALAPSLSSFQADGRREAMAINIDSNQVEQLRAGIRQHPK